MQGMQFSVAEWWMMGTVITLAIGVICYFLKRTMTQVDAHDKDINTIKQTYVTKDEFKELRSEIKEDLDKLSGNMDDLKERSLSRQDFYRAQAETNDNIKRIYDMMLKSHSGGRKDE